MADAAAVLEDVKGVGSATAAALVARYPTLEELALASSEQLTEVKGVGPATARAIQQAVSEAIAETAQADVASESTLDEEVAVMTSTTDEPAVDQLVEDVTSAEPVADASSAAAPIVAEDAVPEVAHHDRPAAATASGPTEPPTDRPEDALPLRPRGTTLPPSTPSADEDAAIAGMDADVIPIHRVRQGVEGTAQDLKGAVDAMWGVVTAAVDAGKSEIPEVRRELQATMDALLDTARTLVEAARDVGKRT